MRGIDIATARASLVGLLVLAAGIPLAHAQFRVSPYLLMADTGGHYRLTWFSEQPVPGEVRFWTDASAAHPLMHRTSPRYAHELNYSQLEETQRSAYPDMFAGTNWQHTIALSTLEADTRYYYEVTQGDARYTDTIHTAPMPGSRQAIRFVTMADSETDPDGRTTRRSWAVGPQAPSSTGRPADLANYLLTETEGFRANLRHVRIHQPHFALLSGDIVQGGGYQRAWDEFFHHTAGKFDNFLGRVPLLPALGNWENFGARNGEYDPAAVYFSRAKYKAYFPAPTNGSARYQDAYYRVDYGPVTIITLDSSNGLPDSTDSDTNINISAATYPGEDLPDINPGSVQWTWAQAQLADAQRAGQLIFVQFHHIPYSSGGHILPLSAEGSSGQAGVPMRAYTPMFEQYGVIAVFCGHNEFLEHSEVSGIHFWDVGIAGDGFGYPGDDQDKRRYNPYSKWIAHRHSPEQWDGQQLIDGGKHYGHLVVDVQPTGTQGYQVIMQPYYVFPIMDDNGSVIRTEMRSYSHRITLQK